VTGDPDRDGPGEAPNGEDDRPEREPSAAGHGSHEIDIESAFAAIVAAWGQETPGGVGPWPASEDVEGRRDQEPPEQHDRRPRPEQPEPPQEPPAEPAAWSEPPAARRAEDAQGPALHRDPEQPGEDEDERPRLAPRSDGVAPMRPRRPRRGRHARRRGDQDAPKDGRGENEADPDRTIELPRDSGFDLEDRDQGEPYRPADNSEPRPRRWGPAEGVGPAQEPLLPAGYGTGDLAGEPAMADEVGQFVPPEPPPLPRGDLVSRLAWGCVLGGPLFLLIAVLLWRDVPRELLAAAVVAFIGGFVVLVARMPGDHDGDGDGAVV
jgi:hypothetical protein